MSDSRRILGLPRLHWVHTTFLAFVGLLASGSRLPAADEREGQPESEAASHFVYLTAETPQTEHAQYLGNLLLRELARQAVLIAARDELGLSTGDMALREPAPGESSAVQQLHLSTLGKKSEKLQVVLYRGDPDERDVVWEAEFPITDIDAYYLPLVAAMEKASRDDLASALRKAGLTGEPNEVVDSAPVPEEVETALGQFNFVSQFSAVRQLHQRIRDVGESPELLGSLVRAYAHLGILTYHHWNASSKAYHARSLLYAERLVARKPPDSAEAILTRAYARSLAGLHAAALADMQAAAELADEQVDATRDIPPWARVGEQFARYDVAGLSEVAGEDGQVQEAAACLAFLALASGGGTANVIETGQAVLEGNPQCYRIYDRLCDFGGVSHLHSATLAGPAMLVAKLPERIRPLPDLPDPVTAVAETLPSAARGPWADPFEQMPSTLAAALVETGTSIRGHGEPSWSVLGRHIEEEIFRQAVRRVRFLKRRLGLPEDGIRRSMQEILPHVAGHPYAAWLESLGVHPYRNAERFQQLLKQVQPGDLCWSVMPLVDGSQNTPLADGRTGAALWQELSLGLDLVSWDQEALVARYRPVFPDHAVRIAKQALKLSPHSPQFLAAVAEDASTTLDVLKTWEEDQGEHAVVLSALSRHHLRSQRFEDAERCARKWIAVSPDQDAYEQLAAVYEAQGKDEQWLETMHAYLDEPDYALGHALFRVKIAEYYMARREWEKALPYAEAAAPTGASFAMSCASKVHEALGNWRQSEEWARRDSERYDIIRHRWYFWCRRNNRGDIGAARPLAVAAVNDFHTQNPPDLWDWVGCFYLLEGDRTRAYAAFAEEYKKRWTYWNGLFLVLLADELGEKDTRDGVLQFMIDNTQEKHQDYSLKKYCDLLREAYSADGKLDLAAVDRLMKSADEANRCDMAYYTAHFLQNRNDEAATDYFRRCYNSWELERFTRTVASVELQNRNVQLKPLAELDERQGKD